MNDQCPSWLYEVKMGATTLWESWDAVAPDGKPHETSMNHYAFGCVGDFMYRRILGIRETIPGYREFVVEPDIDCGLSNAEGSLVTGYGEIRVKWEKHDEFAALEVHIPVNTHAGIRFGNKSCLLGSGSHIITTDRDSFSRL